MESLSSDIAELIEYALQGVPNTEVQNVILVFEDQFGSNSKLTFLPALNRACYVNLLA